MQRALWVCGMWLAGCSAGSTPQEPASSPAEPEAALAQPEDDQTQADDAPERAMAQPEVEDPEGVPGGGPDPMLLQASFSTSIGTPVEGRLEGGVPLPLAGPGYHFNPKKNPQARHGTVELVQALIRAAAKLEPGDPLTINDIAMPQGGDIPGHASHRSGRDVDVLFFLLDKNGEPAPPKPIPIEPDGTGVDYKDLSTAEDDFEVELDVPRTWAFVEALVSDPDAHINRIFVVEHIRDMLLEHARKVGAPKEVIERFGHLTCQPGFPHDDHFHIRFFCEPDDIEKGCEDTRPIYPWHQRYLKERGVQAQIAGRRTKPRPKLTSVDDAADKARAKVGEFHPDVEAFLERRKAWAKKPHPGRKYCK